MLDVLLKLKQQCEKKKKKCQKWLTLTYITQRKKKKMDRFYIYPPSAVWKGGTQGVTLRNEQKQGKLLKTSQPNPQRCKLIFRGLKIQKV